MRRRRRARPVTPQKTVALVGLMGVGKSTVGRRLAQRLSLPFFDGDSEIEAAAGMTVSEIFSQLGEAEFRAGEARIMKRLLEGPPIVLATGGGAMMNAETRALMKKHAVTVWMRADLKVVAERVARRDTRPLLRDRDPLEVLQQLADARYPTYGEADVTVEVGGGSHAQAVDAVLAGLQQNIGESRNATRDHPARNGPRRPYRRRRRSRGGANTTAPAAQETKT